MSDIREQMTWVEGMERKWKGYCIITGIISFSLGVTVGFIVMQ